MVSRTTYFLDQRNFLSRPRNGTRVTKRHCVGTRRCRAVVAGSRRGPSGAAAGNSFGNMAGNWLNNGSNAGNFSNPGNGGNKVGMNTGAYQGGNSIQASPSAANSGFKLPSFGYGGR